ncbi:S46 family peptidase [Urechidicola sp. KH5]
MKFLKFVLLFISFQVVAQQGGMWIPSLLSGMNEQEMQALGSKLTAQDIYDVNNSSLKDAIGHFNGGCTSEVISPKGLVLTNHHCGFSQIQSHSSLENDYLKNGFWAMSLDEELPNEGLYIDFIKSIHDVTAQVLAGTENVKSAKKKQIIVDQNMAKVVKMANIPTWQKAKVKSFYKGNQYFLFVYERFEDIRLVGAPPSSIGKFGSDTDNWVWPRHTGDFSLFRIYADSQNRPAKYSTDNKPYKPAHHLPISLNGVEEGDFTMVFGFPGRTNEYLPAVAVAQITQKINPNNIAYRDAALKVINNYMKQDDQIRIQYASKQARIANSWKKWIGENQGIEKSHAIAKKQQFEEKFLAEVERQQLQDSYGNILTDFKEFYTAYEPVAIKRASFLEVFYRNNELLNLMFKLYKVELAADKGEKVFKNAKVAFMHSLEKFYKNYNITVDRNVYKAIMPMYTDNVDESIYNNTAFTSKKGAFNLLNNSMGKVLKYLNKDAAYAYAKPFIEEFYNEINPEYSEMNTEIAAVQKTYMKALMEVLPEERYYPDANSTLRVTYGQVQGYAPRDGVYYNPVTYLDGVVEKYVPGDYEFDVPAKLIELYEAKDYGAYADKNGKLPVSFIGTNHTTGGNSGSPAIDAEGNLIGLNFDRVWEGTMSDINYDPDICRNIMVDARYILFVIDKFAGASHLIDEMTLVTPKQENFVEKE